jgi:hypothetical protein
MSKIAGTVAGSVEAAVETLDLAPTASIGGDLSYAREATLTREDGATVGGSVTVVDDLSIDGGVGGQLPDAGALNIVFGIYGALVTLTLGAVLLLAFPDFTSDVAAEVATQPLRSGGIGLAGLITIPIALLAVAITIVGIPLTILGFMSFGVIVFVAAALGEYALGSWLLSLAGIRSRWARLVGGVIAVALLSRLPIVGWLVNLLVFLLGFGAVLVVVSRAYRTRRTQDEVETAGAGAGTA